MLTASDPAIGRRLKLLRQHGMTVPDRARHTATQVVFESYDTLGYNYRLTDIQAAVGRVQFRRLPEMLTERRRRANLSAQCLGNAPVVRPIEERQKTARIGRATACGCHSMPSGSKSCRPCLTGASPHAAASCARTASGYADRPCRSPLPRSEEAQDHCLLIPFFNGMTDDQQGRVVKALSEVS